MTSGEVGDRYTELGGQAEPERQRAKRHLEAMRAVLEDKPCPRCDHGLRFHNAGRCFYPCAPHGEDCTVCNESENG